MYTLQVQRNVCRASNHRSFTVLCNLYGAPLNDSALRRAQVVCDQLRSSYREAANLHQFSRARTPLPFSKVTISIGPPVAPLLGCISRCSQILCTW